MVFCLSLGSRSPCPPSWSLSERVVWKDEVPPNIFFLAGRGQGGGFRERLVSPPFFQMAS